MSRLVARAIGWSAGLGLALTASLAIGTASAAKDKPEDAAATAGADKAIGQAWVDYQAPDGLYKARFPGAPTAETTKGVPSYVTARYQTVGGLNAGPMYYVSALVGKSQNTPPPDMLPGLLAQIEREGFVPLGIKISESKPMKDSQGNPGRRLKLAHPASHRTGVGKILVNRLTGVLLLIAGFGPDAEAFVKSAQFM